MTMFRVYSIANISFITKNLVVIQKYSSTLDFINNGIVWSSRVFCYFVWRPAVFQTHFYFMTFF